MRPDQDGRTRQMSSAAAASIVTDAPHSSQSGDKCKRAIITYAIPASKAYRSTKSAAERVRRDVFFSVSGLASTASASPATPRRMAQKLVNDSSAPPATAAAAPGPP